MHSLFPWTVMGSVCTVNSTGLRDYTQPHPHRPQSHTSSMAEQGGASGGGVSFTSSWGKDLSDSARKRYLDSMMAGIMEMGMEGQNSDIDIIVEGQSFPCHKLLLAAGNNSYFHFEYKQVLVKDPEEHRPIKTNIEIMLCRTIDMKTCMIKPKWIIKCPGIKVSKLLFWRIILYINSPIEIEYEIMIYDLPNCTVSHFQSETENEKLKYYSLVIRLLYEVHWGFLKINV